MRLQASTRRPPEAGDPVAVAARHDSEDFGLLQLRGGPRPGRMMVEATGIEPATPCLQSRSSTTELRPRDRQVARRVVGLCGLEPQTLRLSGVRSNHLSYRPGVKRHPAAITR